MFDIEAAIEARHAKSRLADSWLTHDDAATAADRVSATTNRLHRRWLALYRGDRWSLERIAEFDGTTIAKVWCGIVLAMRHEPRIGRRHTERQDERRTELQAG